MQISVDYDRLQSMSVSMEELTGRISYTSLSDQIQNQGDQKYQTEVPEHNPGYPD